MPNQYPPRTAPEPYGAQDGHLFNAPRSPLPSRRNMKIANWVQSKQFIRPHWYTCEELETGAPHLNSYRVPQTGVGAINSSATASIKVDESADFEWVKLTCVAFDEDGVAQNHFGISFRDSGSDRRMDNFPIHMLTITGTGQMPYILPCSLLVKRAAILSITFTLYTAATTYIYMTLSGVKYYFTELQSITTRPSESWAQEQRL